MSDDEEESPQEIDSPDESDPTNPFSKGLKEALEKEREVLEALKDPTKVPAIVCDNRDKIRLAWLSNMNQWKETQQQLAEKDAEIQQKRAENDVIRKQIDVAQVKLAESEVRVQQRCRSGLETSL